MAELLTRSIVSARTDVVLAAPPQRVALRTWGALAILCLGAFLVVLDTTIVNIAIPSIITGLHSSLDQVTWVLNAYTLVYAALLITGGRLGDLYGPRRLLITGILVFGGASVACALAPSAGILIAARVLQRQAIAGHGDDAQLLAGVTLALLQDPALYDDAQSLLNDALDDSYRTDPIWRDPLAGHAFARHGFERPTSKAKAAAARAKRPAGKKSAKKKR